MTTDKLQEFIEAMHSHGIGPANAAEIIADDKRHRYQVEGDRPRTLNGEYCLRVDADGFAVGWFKSYKTMPEAVAWHSRSHKKRVSKEQREEWEARVAADKERRAREDAALRERARVECVRIWGEGEERAGNAYMTRKGHPDWVCRQWFDFDRMEDSLLVPAYKAGELVGLQKVYADGAKLFVPGSDLDGSFHAIGEFEGAETVAVCEGYATGVTIHAATGWPVAVAFNAGNLVKVAKALAAPGLVVCADNDLWTPHPKHRKELPEQLPPRDAPEWQEWRSAGKLLNTGVDAAMTAAGAIGGAQVLYPIEGGDWNDVHMEKGLDTVREHLMGAVAKRAANVPDWEPEWQGDEIGPTWEDVATPDQRLAELTGPLGYDKDVYYFLPKTKGQIIELTATGLGSANNLYQLGSQFEYRQIIGDAADKGSDLAAMVGPMLIDACHRKGIYEPEKVYGAGAWKIGDRVWLNTGREVYDTRTGVIMGHTEAGIDGVFVKEARAYNLDCQPLNNKEANKLAQICSMLRWKRPISGTLLSGWLVISAVGGALRWRPHVFITGPKGAGKSTVVDNIVEPVLRCALRQDGGSTEAGLRRQVGDSCRPFIMDEFEGELMRDRENVQKIFTWCRKASSGGMIVNANGTYRARSCVSFAAINPMIIQGADADRITILELEVNRAPDSEAHYMKLMNMIHDTLTVEYADALVRRTVDNVDALLKNCETFSKHASRILGSKRAGDQIGPMLAGAYMLHATGVVTDAKAEEYCSRQDWSWIDEQQEGTDSERLVRKILNSMIEYSNLDKTVRMPVSEMIARINGAAVDADACTKALARVGMVVKDGWLCIANSDDGLSGLLKDTPWQVYRPGISRYEGCVSDGKTMRFGTGSPRRYMKIPLAGLLDGVKVADMEQEVEW